jgi:LysR family transcriptional regulator of gallate degradation
MVFDHVASTGSFSRAAVTVNRSQPAVTFALRKLEAFVGAELLERRQSGSHTTAAGEILLRRTRRLFAAIDDALLQPLVGARIVEPSKLAVMRSKLSVTMISGLIAIAENPSIQDAALSIGVSKPSFYRIARDIEQTLNCRCFESGARGLAANEVGIELARRFQLALGEIDHALDEIEAINGPVTVHIHVGVRRTSVLGPLNDAIIAFLESFPGAQIRIIDEPFDQLFNDLRHGRLDILYGPIRQPHWAADVMSEALFYRPYTIVVRAGHPLTKMEQPTAVDLADYDWILSKRGSPRRQVFEDLFRDSGGEPSSSVETSSIELKFRLLTSSDRIALLTSRELRQEIEAGLLARVYYPSIRRRAHDGITMRKDWHPTHPQTIFLDLLRKHTRGMDHEEDALALSDNGAG